MCERLDGSMNETDETENEEMDALSFDESLNNEPVGLMPSWRQKNPKQLLQKKFESLKKNFGANLFCLSKQQNKYSGAARSTRK